MNSTHEIKTWGNNHAHVQNRICIVFPVVPKPDTLPLRHAASFDVHVSMKTYMYTF